jgi:hypothetical protein
MGPVSGALASPIDSGVEGTCLPRRIESGHTLYLVTAAPWAPTAGRMCTPVEAGSDLMLEVPEVVSEDVLSHLESAEHSIQQWMASLADARQQEGGLG